MCSECNKQFCPDACPGKEIADVLICEDCGSVLDGCLAYRDHDGNHYCIDCVEGMDTDEILRICGVSSVAEILRFVDEINERNGKEEDRGGAGLFFARSPKARAR